jgi:MscS family membrane protein
LVSSLCCWLFLCLQFAALPVSSSEEHPLAPVDTSSPRTTLLDFLAQVDRHWEIFRDQYQVSPSKQLDQELATIAAKAIGTLNLSEIAPSAQTEAGYDAATFLYDTLSRIELPPVDEIPDSAAFEEVEEVEEDAE